MIWFFKSLLSREFRDQVTAAGDNCKVVYDVCTQVPVKHTLITVAALGSVTGHAGAAWAWFSRYAHS